MEREAEYDMPYLNVTSNISQAKKSYVNTHEKSDKTKVIV